MATGGYQSVLGVTPDLTTFGKIIGGGMPVGAVGGRAEIMSRFAPDRKPFVTHSGTFNGNPMTTAAGCVSLDLLTGAEIERINGLAAKLGEELHRVLNAHGLSGPVTVCGSLLHLHLEAAEEIRTFDDVNLEASSWRGYIWRVLMRACTLRHAGCSISPPPWTRRRSGSWSSRLSGPRNGVEQDVALAV